MTTQAEIKKIENEPAVKIAKHIDESIEQKLNYDGRYHVLTQFESGSRFGKLTTEELDYLGAKMGWSAPYYQHVDWDAVPVPFHAACLEHPHCNNVLQHTYPAPDIKPLIEALGEDDSTAYLCGEISIDQIDFAAIPAVAIEALRDGEIEWADLVKRYPAQEVQP